MNSRGRKSPTIAVDVEVEHDCTTDTITLSLRTSAAACDGQPSCPITGSVPLGTFGATSSPDVENEFYACGP